MATISTSRNSFAEVIWRSQQIGRATVTVLDADLLSAAPDDVSAELGASRLVSVRQVHGADVAWTDVDGSDAEADAIAVKEIGVAAVIRVADCTPIAVVDTEVPLAAVVHAGRAGLVAGVVPAAVENLRAAGAENLVAVIGPRVCGACYELPVDIADAVGAQIPQARATTSWGTPSVDVGAGVMAQLAERGVDVLDWGAGQCTVENEHWFSYRRQGDKAGRFGMAVVLS